MVHTGQPVKECATFSPPQHVFHYLVEGNITYLCMADESMKRRIPFTFLEDVKRRFVTQVVRVSRASDRAEPGGRPRCAAERATDRRNERARRRVELRRAPTSLRPLHVRALRSFTRTAHSRTEARPPRTLHPRLFVRGD